MGKVDLLQPWSDLDPSHPLVGTSIILTRFSETM